MNCDKVRKLINTRFSGGLPLQDDQLVGQHIGSCPKCREFYLEEKELTDRLKSLDYIKYREESIDAFGRLAATVRSYRSPKTSWSDSLRVKPLRLGWVSAMLLLILVGLSNLSVSYSYTSGANLKIDFDPPLKKAETIEINDFYAKINDALNDVLKDPEGEKNIELAIQMKSDALESISIDINTDEAIDIADIYDSLLNDYPSFARGEVSISPLKKELKRSAFNTLIAREPNLLADAEIREIVENKLPVIISRTESRIRIIEKDGDKIQKVIEDELPAIRNLINSVNDRFGEASYQVSDNDMIVHNGGAQLQDLKSLLIDPSDKIMDGIEEILLKQNVKLDDINLDEILSLNFNNGVCGITIGQSDGLFEPYSVGGKKISIIRGSGRNVDLNGVDDYIASTEIDNLLDGTINPDELQNTINERLANNNLRNETVVVEVFKGGKKAEIRIKDNKAEVQLTAPPTPNINIKMKDLNKFKNSEDLKDLLKWKKELESEREIVLKHYNATKDESDDPLTPPLFSLQNDTLSEFITEDELEALAKGALPVDELEKRIEERIKDNVALFGNRNMAFLKDGKAITIDIYGGKVSIFVNNNTLPGMSSGSVVITHQEESIDNTNSRNLNANGAPINLVKDGVISENDIDDVMRGELLPSLLENMIRSKLDEKFGDKWRENFSSNLTRTRKGKTVEIKINNGNVSVTVD